jgi:hypothetical protein
MRRDGRERDSSKKYYWNISVKGRLIRKEGVAGFLFMTWCAAAYYIYILFLTRSNMVAWGLAFAPVF